MSMSFYDLLNEQIGHEFAASHQYRNPWLSGSTVRTCPNWPQVTASERARHS